MVCWVLNFAFQLSVEYLSIAVGLHPAAVASTTWAFARLRLHLPGDFVERAQETLGRMEPQDASLTLWALAKLRCQLSNLEVKRGRWTSRDASTALWACATMQRRPPAMCMEIWCKAFLEKMHSATQQVGNVVWCIWMIRNRLFWRRLLSFDPKQVVWCTADKDNSFNVVLPLRIFVGFVMSASLHHALPQDISNMLWALATLNISTALSQRCVDEAPLERLHGQVRSRPTSESTGSIYWM